jgi:hypothetical protein
MPELVVAISDRKATVVECGTGFCLGLGKDCEMVGEYTVDLGEFIKQP